MSVPETVYQKWGQNKSALRLIFCLTRYGKIRVEIEESFFNATRSAPGVRRILCGGVVQPPARALARTLAGMMRLPAYPHDPAFDELYTLRMC